MMTKKYRFFTLLFTILFCVGLMAGCVYTAAPSASQNASASQNIGAAVPDAYKAAPSFAPYGSTASAKNHFYYVEGKIARKEFSYSSVADIELYQFEVESDDGIFIIAKDFFTAGWDDLVASQGTQVRLYFYLLGSSEIYTFDIGLYCGFAITEEGANQTPFTTDLAEAVSYYTKTSSPKDPPTVTVPNTGSFFPIYESGPYTVGEDMYEGLYLLASTAYDASYAYTYVPEGYNRLLYNTYTEENPNEASVDLMFCMRYLVAGRSYTFHNTTAVLLSDFTEYWGDEVLDSYGKNKDGTFVQGTYQVGTMLSAGTYEIIPYYEDSYYYYSICYTESYYGLYPIESDFVEDGTTSLVTVEEGQFLQVEGAYIKPVKTTA